MILYMFFSVQNIWDWEARFNFLCGFCPARQLCDNLYFYLPYVDSSAINDRYDIVYKCFFFSTFGIGKQRKHTKPKQNLYRKSSNIKTE